MKSFLFIVVLFTVNKCCFAQHRWIPKIEIYTGIGKGIGQHSKSLSQYNELNSINHSIHFIAFEINSAYIPFSIEYDITASNYIRKTTNSQTSSRYTLHKIGIGLDLKRNVLIKLKYLLNNQFREHKPKPNYGTHISIGIENSFPIGNISKNKVLNMDFRIMTYYEHTFGDLNIQDSKNLNALNVTSPYRNTIGLSLWIKPRLTKKHQPKASSILPPY